jgi:hypothetical protein
VVSCHFPVGTPASVLEGSRHQRARGHWMRVAPMDGVDGNRTALTSLQAKITAAF